MLLAVLKIIGCVLLGILAFLLLALILLLFLPFRYKIRLEGDKESKYYYARADVTWLLRFLHASYALGGGEGDKGFSVRVLGFKLHRGKKEAEAEPQLPCEGESDIAKNTAIEEEKECEAPKSEDAPLALSEGGGAKGTVQSRLEEKEKTPAAEEPYSPSEKEDMGEGGLVEEKLSLWDRLKGFFGFLNNLRKKAFRIFLSLGRGVDGAIRGIKKLIGKAAFCKEFFEDPATERALRLVIGELKRLIKAILPKKCEAYLHIGMEDPALTGGILGGLSALGMVHRHSIQVKPEFEEEVLEGHIFMKGALPLYIVAIILWRLYFDKDLRPAWRRFKRGLRE